MQRLWQGYSIKTETPALNEKAGEQKGNNVLSGV